MPDRKTAWIESGLAECPRTEFRDLLRKDLERKIMVLTTGVREGFSSVTPYLSVVDVERLVAFAKAVFGAVETGRSRDGRHIHCELRIGDSMLMCRDVPAVDLERRNALHIYVPDVDALYRRALESGGESMYQPDDKPYGDREAGVKDPTGNIWFIATRHAGLSLPKGMRRVTPFVLANNALGLIEFVKHAFGASEEDVHKSPDGKLLHAMLWIGDGALEFGEAAPLPATFYLYVPDVDAVYSRALEAGAKPLLAPSNQAYGDRLAAVGDAWGNGWCIASHLG